MHTVVFSSFKGGVGKTTLAGLTAAAAACYGRDTRLIDLDLREPALERFVALRRALDLPVPAMLTAPEGPANEYFETAVETLAHQLAAARADGARLVLIDAPGFADARSVAAHMFADAIVTPITDSPLDLAALEQTEIRRSSPYRRFIEGVRRERLARLGQGLNWIVCRNRVSPLPNRATRQAEETLERLSRGLGFRIGRTFTDRIVHRVAFDTGRTALDLAPGEKLTMSLVGARFEILSMLNLMHERPEALAA